MSKERNIELLDSLRQKIEQICDNKQVLADRGMLKEKIQELNSTLFEIAKEENCEITLFGETVSNKSLKSEYVKVTFILDELKFLTNLIFSSSSVPKELTVTFMHVKSIMLPLSLAYQNIKTWSKYCLDDSQLIDLLNSLKGRLEFANHMRNKISGHLDTEVIDILVQWEPFIFHEACEETKDGQRLLMYRSLLETAINSYQDSQSGCQKVFNREIDLNIPDEADLFFDYLYNLAYDCMNFLNLFAQSLDSRIKYSTGLPIDLSEAAGATDFKLKSKGR